MEVLKCENLKKIYKVGEQEVIALSSINLSIEKGEYISVIGTSGSGKSTLLYLLAGLEKPTEGKIWVEEKNITQLNNKDLALYRRRKIGLIYQFYNLIPTLSVERNILLPLLLDKKDEDKNYYRQIVESLGIGNILKFMPHQLSGGQQQRVAIARTLLYKPDIILADEPTGNLDRKNSEEIIRLFQKANKDFGQTIILVTHDERISLTAKRRIEIVDGEIISEKRLESLY